MISDKSIKFYNKKILILGGTGFIGANLVDKLVGLQAKVYVMLRRESKLDRLQKLKDKVTFCMVDFTNSAEVTQAIQEIDPQYVFNFAHPSGFGLKNADAFATQVSESTRLLTNVLNAVNMACTNLISFVHGGSCFVYQWDSTSYLLSEKTPLGPSTYRGLIKLNERNICRYFVDKYNLPVKIARIFRAYGPWDHDYKLIIKVLKTIQSNGSIAIGKDEFKRDYIYIEDLAEGILALAGADQPPGTEINFGGGTQYSAAEIVTVIEKILGIEVNKTNDYTPNQYDKGNILADITLAKNQLDWEPRFTIEKGLTKTISWFKDYYQWTPK